MLGYVIINKNELSQDELNVYRSYYCGVCKSIGRRFGQIPRGVLSYDSVFLGMILSSIKEDEEGSVNRETCIVHPFTKNPVLVGDSAVDYAADMLILLAYHNFLDDRRDEHKLRGLAGSMALRPAFVKLEKHYPIISKSIEEGIWKLSLLEEEKCDSIDMTAEAFGQVLMPVFSGYEKSHILTESSNIKQENRKRILENLGFNLGRWIYLMDAIDDYEKDLSSGSYNTLIYRNRGFEGLEELLYSYLGNISGAMDLLNITRNKGIIENIIWNGLRARTDLLLTEKNKESNKDSNNEGK